jgi:hypothetical protein
MAAPEPAPKKTIKPRLPAAYFSGTEDVAERRRKLIDGLNKSRTAESDRRMIAIAKEYGVLE